MKNSYFSKWVLQRLTAAFLIPLSFWFIYQCISFQFLNYNQILFFFKSYINSILFFIMMINILVHAKLGCDTIVIDYVSSKKIQKHILNLIYLLTLALFFLMVFALIKLKYIL